MTDYNALKVVELRELASQRGVKLASSARKSDIIDALVAAEKKEAEQKTARAKAAKPSAPAQQPKSAPRAAAERAKPAPQSARTAPAPKSKQPAGRKGQAARAEKPAPAQNQRQTPNQRPAQAQSQRSAAPRTANRAQAQKNGAARTENQQSTARMQGGRPNARPQPEAERLVADTQAARPVAERIVPERPLSERPASERPSAERQEPAMAQDARTEPAERPAAEPAPEVQQGRESADCAGILDLHSDGYGFLRITNYLPGPGDIYVSNTMIRRFNLRSGDYIEGKTFIEKRNERNSALIYISRVNDCAIDSVFNRKRFEDLIPVYPDERITLESASGNNDLAIRLIDILAPIGFGQRGMIVSPPKAGKTTLLKKIANAISRNHPEAHLMVLLIDERPEEVTDMQRSVDGEVLASTFDQLPEHHARLAEMTLDRAQRLVECGRDVVVLLDSITRLSRAYNLIIPSTGRSLSGGLDPGALYKPKRFFGAARNIENGGSLTVIATALVDMGSRMDDIIFEEFKGTGNMEIVLDRKLSERRVFPAIDLAKSGTRREDLLLTEEEMDGVLAMRKVLQGNSGTDSTDQLISMMMKSQNNAEFFQRLKGWVSIWEKEGFVMQNR